MITSRFYSQGAYGSYFCGHCKKWIDTYLAAGLSPRKPGAGDLMLAVTDAAIAAQNAVTAAESLGIGSAILEILWKTVQQRRLLNLPDYVFPAVMLDWLAYRAAENSALSQSALTGSIWYTPILTAVWIKPSFGKCSMVQRKIL